MTKQLDIFEVKDEVEHLLREIDSKSMSIEEVRQHLQFTASWFLAVSRATVETWSDAELTSRLKKYIAMGK